jgi:hypothetical protein
MCIASSEAGDDDATDADEEADVVCITCGRTHIVINITCVAVPVVYVFEASSTVHAPRVGRVTRPARHHCTLCQTVIRITRILNVRYATKQRGHIRLKYNFNTMVIIHIFNLYLDI